MRLLCILEKASKRLSMRSLVMAFMEGSLGTTLVVTGSWKQSLAKCKTGIQQEQAQAAVEAISGVVEDSPNKIFIAGISKILSSDMLMEIVTAFGSLKAYHFEFKEELNGACAFIEYVEPCTTLKACAGLNGIKLGGNILTAVQATPHAHWEDITEGVPSYDIPEHAKPLLASPTKVLQLKNMLTQEEFSLLSEPEIEETLEGIRLECARFGAVKSVNVVRNESSSTVIPRVAVQETNGESTRVESTKESHNSYTEQNDLIPPSNTEELNDGSEAEEDTNINDAKLSQRPCGVVAFGPEIRLHLSMRREFDPR